MSLSAISCAWFLDKVGRMETLQQTGRKRQMDVQGKGRRFDYMYSVFCLQGDGRQPAQQKRRAASKKSDVVEEGVFSHPLVTEEAGDGVLILCNTNNGRHYQGMGTFFFLLIN
jgi:hypothetical protein